MSELVGSETRSLDRRVPSPLDEVWSIVARLDIIPDRRAEVALLRRLTAPTRPMVVSFVNQHALNLAWSSGMFAETLRSADVLLRDGVGLECCLRLNGCPTGLNMNGSDFIPKLAAAYAGRRVAIFGTQDPWTSRAAAAFGAMGCNVVGVMDGFQPEDEYISETLRIQPELIVLAMSMPKQERVAALITAAVATPLLVVNGGAIADFLARRVSRAPKFVRALRLEWMFRLAIEPSRLASRYLTGGAAFLWRMVLLHAGGRAALVRLLYVSETRRG